MIINVAKKFILAASALMLGGCVSYSVTEQEMTDYLQDSVMLEQEVGVQNVMYAQVAVDDLAVKLALPITCPNPIMSIMLSNND